MSEGSFYEREFWLEYKYLVNSSLDDVGEGI